MEDQQAEDDARREKNRKHALNSRRRKQDLLDSAMRTAGEVASLRTQIDNLRGDVLRLHQENVALHAGLKDAKEALAAAVTKVADEQFQSNCAFRADLNYIMLHVPDSGS